MATTRKTNQHDSSNSIVLLTKKTANDISEGSNAKKRTVASIGGKRKARKEQHSCPICEELILDATVKKPGHDAVKCDGTCAAWLHRRCAGLSETTFIALCASDKKFYCPQCRLDKQELEITSLKGLVSSLSSKLDDIKCYLDSRAPSTPSTSYASTVLNGMSMQPAVSVTKPLPITQETSVRGPNGDRNDDRKFNLVISGLSECA